MNLGRYERYIADYGLRRVRVEEIAVTKADRADWNLPENVRLSLAGVEVSVPQGSRGGIELSVSRNDVYTDRVHEQRTGRGRTDAEAEDAGG